MALFTPTIISTSLWLDASDASTITISTGVSQWRDKSGNSRHAAQPTATYQPVVAASALNGLNGIAFNGNDFFSCGDVLDLGTDNQTIFVVASMAATGVQTLIAKSLSAGAAGRYAIYWDGANLAGYYSWTTTADSSPTVSFSPTAPRVISTSIVRGASPQHTLLVSGAVAATTTPAVESNNLQTPYRLLLGAYNNSTDSGQTFYLNGRMYEIIVLNRSCSVEERQLIDGYLHWKWGLQDNLATDHPYRHVAPTTGFIDPLHVFSGLGTSILPSVGECEFAPQVDSFVSYGTSIATSFGEVEFSLPVDSFNGSGYSDAFSSSSHFTPAVDQFSSYGFAGIVGNVKFKQPAPKNHSIGFSGDQIYDANFDPKIDCFSSKGQSTIIGRVVFSGHTDKIVATGEVKSVSIGSASFVDPKNIFISKGSATILARVEFKEKICALSASGVHHIVGNASFENKIDIMRSRGLELPSIGVISYLGKFGLYPPPPNLEPAQSVTPIKFSRN